MPAHSASKTRGTKTRVTNAQGTNEYSARDLATQHQRSDGGEIEQVEADAGRESRCVVAVVIVNDAGEPGAGRHTAAAEKKQRRHPPARLARREIFADRQHIGRNERTEA